MSRHKKAPSPEFLSFANAQLEILPSVLDLLHAHRVPPLSLLGLAGSICSLSGLLNLPPFTPVRPQIRSHTEVNLAGRVSSTSGVALPSPLAGEGRISS